jgi:hypothetical protein
MKDSRASLSMPCRARKCAAKDSFSSIMDAMMSSISTESFSADAV